MNYAHQTQISVLYTQHLSRLQDIYLDTTRAKIQMKYFDSTNKPVGIRRLYLAAKNSLRAVNWLLRNESAFRQEAFLLIIMLFKVLYGQDAFDSLWNLVNLWFLYAVLLINSVSPKIVKEKLLKLVLTVYLMSTRTMSQ